MSDVKRLYRSRSERKFVGVCSGIAEYLDVDPTIARVLYLLGTIMTGFFPGGVINTTDVFRVLPPFLGASCTP